MELTNPIFDFDSELSASLPTKPGVYRIFEKENPELEKSPLVFHIPRREVLFQGRKSLSPCFVISTYLRGRGFFYFF
jgi:hypothetical protein